MADNKIELEAVRRVAELSRLRLSEEEAERQQTRLAAVLGYIDRLGELDLDGVEPLTHPEALINRLAEDEPVAGVLSPEDLARIAPAMEGPYVSVPKVIGGDGGA